ncbi:MAG: hypothetical protein Kow0063_40260 [Anaerolineae bacterium]
MRHAAEWRKPHWINLREACLIGNNRLILSYQISSYAPISVGGTRQSLAVLLNQAEPGGTYQAVTMPLRGTMKHENRGADFLVCPGTGWKACPTLAIFRVEPGDTYQAEPGGTYQAEPGGTYRVGLVVVLIGWGLVGRIWKRTNIFDPISFQLTS